MVDSAFGVHGRPCLIQSSNSDSTKEPGVDEAKSSYQLNVQATALRQTAEHGMRTIQGQFPRLKDNLFLEEQGERKITLHLMVLLHNFQCEKIGMNEILNTFRQKDDPFWSNPLPRTQAGMMIVW